MSELLLVTGRWPFGTVTEFLDREIYFLADAFDVVRVAPMRPSGSLRAHLPGNVVVDEGLAHALTPARRLAGSKARHLAGLRNLLSAQSVSGGWVVPEGSDRLSSSWWRQAALARADSIGVSRWAQTARVPDITYTFWLSPATVGIRNAWRDVPLVSRAHGGDVYAHAHGWQTIPQQGQQLAAATWVGCVSEHGRNFLAQKFPDRVGILRTRHLGVHDLGGLSEPSMGPALRVLSASSVDRNKRVTLIAECLIGLARRGNRIEWTHLGDGPELQQVEALVRRSPRELVATLPGHVDQSEVHEQMRNGGFDVFVNLSKSEGLPVTIMEAQCVGLPVVATDVGGTAEVAFPDLNQLISSGPSVSDVEVAILRAAASGPNVAHERRERWARNFNSEKNYRDFARELAETVQ